VHTVLETAQRGETVLYIDYENGERWIRGRLKRLGMTKEQGAKVAHLHAMQALSAESNGDLCRFVRDQGVTLVVIDSLARALASARRDENLNSDIAWFFGSLEHLRATGVCVLIIDHVGHNHGGHKVQKPRGGSAKIDQVGVAYYFRVTEAWSKTQSGSAQLVSLKHRFGDCADHDVAAVMTVSVSVDVMEISMTATESHVLDVTDDRRSASIFLEMLNERGAIVGISHATDLLASKAKVSTEVATTVIRQLIARGFVTRNQDKNGMPVTLSLATAESEALVA